MSIMRIMLGVVRWGVSDLCTEKKIINTFFHVIFQDIRYVKMWGGGNGWTICIIILQSSKSKKRGAKAEK